MDINIDKAVNTLFDKFDTNKNGKIESSNKEFKTLNVAEKNVKPDDIFAKEKDKSSSSLFGTDYYQVELIDNTKLFKNADTNNDGIVTKEELKNRLSSYDKNKDGKLDTNIFDFFNKSKKEGNVFDRENKSVTTPLSSWSYFRPSPKELEDLRNNIK